MALHQDETAVRDALDDLIGHQPPAPPGRYAAIRGRVVRRRWRHAATAAGGLLAAAGVMLAIVALPASGPRPAVARSRPVPGWALPWPDHRDGSVPQHVLDHAVAAWRHAMSMQTHRQVPSAPVLWYVGQTVPRSGRS